MKFFARIKTVLSPATLQQRLTAELAKQNELLQQSLNIIQQHEAQVSISNAMIAVLETELEKLQPQDRRVTSPMFEHFDLAGNKMPYVESDAPIDFRTGVRLFGQ